jgi:putative membrane protein
MGLANLVPGISGGTMLLAVGIYPRFIDAVARATALRLDRATLVVLGSVGSAAAAAILLLAGPVKELVVHRRWVMYSLFIGLTLGGIPVVRTLIREAVAARTPAGGGAGRVWSTPVLAGAAAGFVAMAGLAWVQMQGAQGGDGAGWPLFFAGGLAGAAAMILPGVSGGYLLLVLGAYVPILAGIDAFRAALGTGDVDALVAVGLGVILPVGLGVVVGIAAVSHALRWLLERYRLATLGVLMGLLVGAVVGLWPFQDARLPEPGERIKGRAVEVVRPGSPAPGGPPPVVRFADDGEVVAVEDLPTTVFTPAPLQVAGAAGLIALGFALTVGVSRLGRRP